MRKMYVFLWVCCFNVLIVTTALAETWGYEPDTVMPHDWGTISGSSVCGSGLEQSPVDFSHSFLTPWEDRVKPAILPDLELEYHESPLNVVNNGHTIQFNYESGNHLKLWAFGEVFEVLQFHFHAPAEHSFEQGALYEMEMHIVHRSLSDPNQLAVLGVMIKQGNENQTLAPIWNHRDQLLHDGDHVIDYDLFINIEEALPDNKQYYAYQGSLTTPPCSEVVKWRVLRNPIEMSRAQIHDFVSIMDNSCCATNGNNRPTQDLNNRKVFMQIN